VLYPLWFCLKFYKAKNNFPQSAAEILVLMFVWQCITSTTMSVINKMQQLFRLLIFLNQPYIFPTTNSPIIRSTFSRLYSNISLEFIVPKGVHTVIKCSWGWANLSPETYRADLKILINEKGVASCWLLTSLKFWLLPIA